MISCMEMMEKFWERFAKVDVRLLQIKTSPEKFRRVEKESIKFGQNVTNELVVDIKTFCVCKKQHRFFNAKFWLIFGYVVYLYIFCN